MIYGEDRPFPPDIRVEKEIDTLSRVGHKVTVLAKRIPNTAARAENIYSNSSRVKRVVLRKPLIFEEFWRLISLQNLNWAPHLVKFVEEDRPDVIHVHDFNLVPTALHVCRGFKIPLIADLHENMPAARKVSRLALKPIPRLLSAIAFNYYLWKWYEFRTLPKCDRVIVVVPEAAKRLYKYGIPESKIVLVSNTEDETTFKVKPEIIDPEIMKKYHSNWVVSYIGGLGQHRGLDTTIKAITEAAKEIPDLMLLIVGARENTEKYQLLNLIKRLGADNWIDVIEWQPFDQINSYIMISQACLVPYNNFEHTQTTVPHKLFQYMICAKPVVVSDCRPLARIVNETQSGLVFKAGNSMNLAKKLIQLYNDPKTAAKMGMQGKAAALGPYSWRHDAKRLADMYANF